MADFILEPNIYESREQEWLLFINNSLSFSKNYNDEVQELLNSNPNIFCFADKNQILEFEILHGVQFPKFPPEKYKRAYSNMFSCVQADIAEDNFNKRTREATIWKWCMPQSVYYNTLLNFCKEISETLDGVNSSYWRNIYPRINDCIRSLCSSRVDVGLWKEFCNKETLSNKEILKSFAPAQDGMIMPPVYSLIGTRTGRLKVLDGPNILNLKKEYRSILKSNHGSKGNLWYLDYSSLEPRILLLTNQSTTPLIGSLPQRTASMDLPLDIYTKALKDLGLEGLVPRTIAKTAILSAIYGQSEETTAKSLKEYLPKPEDFVAALNDYFGIGQLKKKLSENLLKTNGKYIQNLYERPVLCDEAKPYALLNYYVQSTAVDVALLGFSAIINRLTEYNLLDMISPVFILHDALILDIHEDLEYVIPKLEKLGSTGILKFKHTNFFLRAEKLNG